MAAPIDVNAPNTQNPFSSATGGGAFDTQARFTFGGITTTGVGGSTSTTSGSDNSLSTYASIAVIAAAVVGIIWLLKK